MGILVDSSVLIALEQRGGAVPPAWRHQDLGLAAMTAKELLVGVQRADAARRAGRSAFVEGVLAAIPTLPFDLAAARLAAQIETDLARAGTPIGYADVEIAATALARGWSLARENRADFARVPGLLVLSTGEFDTQGH